MAKFGILQTIRDIAELTKELSTRLRALTFVENFDSFETEVDSLAASTSLRVRNELTVIPSRFIIVDSKGESNIARSGVAGEEWTQDYIYFRNYGSNTAEAVKIVILR